MAKQFNEVKTPFTNMTYSPDLPSSALGANEYNSGKNVETDIRGIRSVLGDEEILNQLTGTPIYITSGYRANGVFWFVVATLSNTNQGRWYAIDAAGITNITPGYGSNPSAYLAGYYEGMPITDCWNGTTLFINDALRPPMYLLEAGAELQLYSDDPLAVPPTYIWNYNPLWSALRAGWMRLYATPNVGSILIAGNLSADVILTGITEHYPTTVRWSQAFGLNSGPTTWAPTTTNVANELEVPVRGPVLDGFPMGGNFYVCSYWDTVVFSPISYQGTNNPVLGVRLLSQGRGLLNENCWANADTLVYGLDARDIWSFDGSNFKSLGNQRVKNWFYDNLNPLYTNRVFVINNTSKQQIEIYYPDKTSTGWCNKMLAYRYDLDVFQPPRDIANATQATESPIYTQTGNVWAENDASRTVVYTRGVADSKLVQKDKGHQFIGNVAIQSEFRRDNIQLLKDYSGQLLVHRILPEVVNLDSRGVPVADSTGNITITIGGADSVGAAPTFKSSVTMQANTTQPWTQIDQNAFRVNSIKITNTSNTHTWLCSATTWQFTQTEDSR